MLDEPTSALDRGNAAMVFDEVAQAVKSQLVVVVTHRPELLKLCSTIVYVADGAVVDAGPVDEITAKHTFVSGWSNIPTEAHTSNGNENLF